MYLPAEIDNLCRDLEDDEKAIALKWAVVKLLSSRLDEATFLELLTMEVEAMQNRRTTT